MSHTKLTENHNKGTLYGWARA